MIRRRAVLAVLAGVVASTSACSGCKDDAGTPAGSSTGSGDAALADASSATSSGSSASSDGGLAIGISLSPEDIAKVVNPYALATYAGPTGSVEGTVYVTGDAAPATGADFHSCPAAEASYGKAFRDGPPLPDGRRPLADALVIVTGYAGYLPERVESKDIVIKDCAFVPRTVDITFGQRISVKNLDTSLHAPEVESTPLPALMVAPQNGDPVNLYPHKPGYTQIVDKMGPDFLKADLYVFLHPLHTVTDTSGHYRIDGIPVGKVDVNSRLRAINHDVTKEIEVVANVVQKLDLVLDYKKPKAAAAHADAGGGSAPKPPSIH